MATWIDRDWWKWSKDNPSVNKVSMIKHSRAHKREKLGSLDSNTLELESRTSGFNQAMSSRRVFKARNLQNFQDMFMLLTMIKTGITLSSYHEFFAAASYSHACNLYACRLDPNNEM